MRASRPLRLIRITRASLGPRSPALNDQRGRTTGAPFGRLAHGMIACGTATLKPLIRLSAPRKPNGKIRFSSPAPSRMFGKSVGRQKGSLVVEQRTGFASMAFLSIQKHMPARWSEWIFGCMLISWGLILARPEATFATSPSYIGLARIAPEWVWALSCTVAGVVRIFALIANGHWVPRSYHLRSGTAFLSAGFWFTITLGIMATGTASTGLAVYPWLCLADVYNCYRVARDLRLERGLVA